MTKLTVVTGAAGFIGRNAVAELNARGNDDLLLVDHLGKDEKWKNVLGLRYEDFISPDQFIDRLETLPIRSILHLGACSATTERDADFLLRNNYQYTRRLCEHSIKHGIRFVYASSAATYGDGGHGYSDEDSVTPQLRPLNMYGYSKHMFDLWAMKTGLLDRIVGLKFFNVFGPYEDHKGSMRSVVNKSYYDIRDHGHVSLFKSHRPNYSDGEQQRDFVYVKDAVDVCLHFLKSTSHSGLLNCGTGVARSWKDLANAVFAAMNLPVDIRFIDMPLELQGKYQYFTQADIGKLRRCGYTKPFTSLEDAAHDFVAQYLSKI